MSEIWLDDFEVKSRKEPCSCGNLMKCEVAFHREFGEGQGIDYTYIIQVFKILTCPRCNLSTVLLYSTEGDAWNDSQEQSSEPPQRKYSRQILYAPKKQLHSAIPLPSSDVVNQAQAVLASSPRACFILCRAVLEEVCNDLQISPGNLCSRLYKLFNQEKMPEDLQQIILGIKELGNKGAHAEYATFKEKVKFQEGENLLLLVNYVLESMYVDDIRQQEATETLTTLKRQILSSES